MPISARPLHCPALLVALLVTILAPARLRAQDKIFSPGLAVGARVPLLTMTDSDGKPRKLAKLGGPKGMLFVLFRSAKW